MTALPCEGDCGSTAPTRRYLVAGAIHARLCASCAEQAPGGAVEQAAEWLERQLAMGRDQHRPVRT